MSHLIKEISEVKKREIILKDKQQHIQTKKIHAV